MIRTRWALATLLATCLLGACSDDDPEPDIADPTASSSSSPATVSPSPTVTSQPALGPDDTVRAWVDARNAALQDGDTSDVRAFSAPGCGTCDQHIAPIEGVYESGGAFDTPGWTIDRLKVVEQSNNKAKVDVAMTMAAGQTVQQAGATPVTYPEDHRLMFFRLAQQDAGWRISFVGYYS